MIVLVVNAGSSSVKLRLLDAADRVVDTADLPADASGFDDGALTSVLRDWPPPDAVGHRIVHGGTVFTGPVRVDDGVRARLGELTDLAPLHQPKSLAGLDAVRARLPDVPAVACFDTAFHTSMAAAASTYAVPREWRDRYGVRRYGFHGLSHAYAASRVADLLGGRPHRLISCHLGAGASVTAIVDGQSVDTTMGFTPLEGLVMATRSGTIDPGLVLWLQQHASISADELSDALEHRSGLMGLAGTADLRSILARDDAEALLAVDVFVHRLVTHVGAMTAAAGGVDALIFTGGIGEHAPLVRARAAGGLAHLGVLIDPATNDAADGDTDVGAPGAAVRTFVIEAREDLQIAREVRGLLG